MAPQTPTRILFVENHPAVQDGFTAIIGLEADFAIGAVVDTAEDSLDALAEGRSR